MITEEKMLEMINKATVEYTGLCGDLTTAIGILVLSRAYGWKVMRLVSSRRSWQVANKIFGDIKEMTPERGEHARKSVGLEIADKLGEYWDLISGKKKVIPELTRKMITNVVE